MTDLCTCLRCQDERREGQTMTVVLLPGPSMPGWAYACKCGNKRCPHHADHRFVCTNDNGVGQIGVIA